MRDPSPSDPGLRSLQLVCGAIMSGVVVFLAVAWMVTPAEGFSPGMDPALVQALATLAILPLVGASLFESKRRRIAAETPPSDQAGWQRSTKLVAFALREAGGFVAVLLGLLTGRMGFAAILVAVVLLVMVLSFPRQPRG